MRTATALWEKLRVARAAITILASHSTQLRRLTAVSIVLSVPSYTTDREVIEGSDRICLRPQADLTRPQPRVTMVNQQRVVEPPLDAIAYGHDTQRMPLTERGRLDARRGKLVPSTVVGIQPKVVLQSVGPDDIVAPLREVQDDAAGSILTARNELKPHGDVDVRVWT